MWNSKHQPRWNAVATGPKRDIVGEWAKAARKRGLRFGVSEHLSNSLRLAGRLAPERPDGPYAGIPYDGTDPSFADLYHDLTPHARRLRQDAPARWAATLPDAWKMEYYLRVKDLVDQHEPDMLYTDGGIPFNEYGLSTVAESITSARSKHGGKVEAVYFTKTPRDVRQGGRGALDRERGVRTASRRVPGRPTPALADGTTRGGRSTRSPKKVVDLLVDIVSKNGNLLLNFPLPNSGKLDPDEMDDAGRNHRMDGGEQRRHLRHASRGRSTARALRPRSLSGNGGFNEGKKPDMGADDIRYTTKGPAMYAFVMGWPRPRAGASRSEVVCPLWERPVRSRRPRSMPYRCWEDRKLKFTAGGRRAAGHSAGAEAGSIGYRNHTEGDDGITCVNWFKPRVSRREYAGPPGISRQETTACTRLEAFGPMLAAVAFYLASLAGHLPEVRGAPVPSYRKSSSLRRLLRPGRDPRWQATTT